VNYIRIDDVAALVAELVNPVLVLLLLAAPWAPRKPNEGAIQFWVSSAAAIALATLIAEAGKNCSVWPGHDTFPSGHESFGAAAGICLAGYDRDWLWFVVPLLAVFGWALVTAGYHDPPDIIGAIVVGPASALLARYVVRSIYYRLRSAGRDQT
jgi:membrane-associated phospholipid phosphatase